jgi:hypothetical protein
MTIKLGNLKGVEAWNAGGGLPAGEHICRIDDAKPGKSKNGYEQIELTWTAIDGPFQGAEKRDWLTLTENSMGKVVALLEAVSFEIPDGDLDLKVSDLIGRHAAVVVRDVQKYNGEPGELVPKIMGYKRPVRDVVKTGASDIADSDLPF